MASGSNQPTHHVCSGGSNELIPTPDAKGMGVCSPVNPMSLGTHDDIMDEHEAGLCGGLHNGVEEEPVRGNSGKQESAFKLRKSVVSRASREMSKHFNS